MGANYQERNIASISITTRHFASTSGFAFVVWSKDRDAGVDTPRTPTPRTISAIPNELPTDNRWLKITLPTSVINVIPTADQIAYAIASGTDFKANDIREYATI